MALEFASATDPGRVRSHNEDSIGTDPEIGLAVLADGMGGYNAGEVASGIAVAVVSSEIKKALNGRLPYRTDPSTGETEAERIARQHALKANTSIFEAARSQPQYAGMGTTLVATLFFLVPVSFFRPWIGVLAWFWVAYFVPQSFTWGFGRNLPVAMVVALATLLARELAARADPPLTKIGVFTKDAGVLVVDRDGREEALPVGYEHFSDRKPSLP